MFKLATMRNGLVQIGPCIAWLSQLTQAASFDRFGHSWPRSHLPTHPAPMYNFLLVAHVCFHHSTKKICMFLKNNEENIPYSILTNFTFFSKQTSTNSTVHEINKIPTTTRSRYGYMVRGQIIFMFLMRKWYTSLERRFQTLGCEQIVLDTMLWYGSPRSVILKWYMLLYFSVQGAKLT